MSTGEPDLGEFHKLTEVEDLQRQNLELEAKLRQARNRIKLDTLPPVPADTLHHLPLQILDGQTVRFGIVSDTHLSSKACALAELHAAYDWLEREGIRAVYHAGDWTDGVGIYRGQHKEITRHTFEDQVDHLEAEYPRRDGIVTYGIGGNHDLEGEFTGSDPVKALAKSREDVVYLGEYSAYVEILPGCTIHLLHGKGGGSYALSYKLQKHTDAYAGGRKPSVLVLGHFHGQIVLQSRGIQAMLPGCFQGQTPFSIRLGLQPQLGFHAVEATIGDDGSIVGWKTDWRPFYEGRRVG